MKKEQEISQISQQHVGNNNNNIGLIKNKEYWINKLNLEKHPEGGFFIENIKSEDSFFDKESNKTKVLFTSIYYLLENGSKSLFHRISSDEIWYHHFGDSLTIHCIAPNGEYTPIKLGNGDGELLQYNVKKGTIFAGASDNDDSESLYQFSLVGCLVSPGFVWEEFEKFTKSNLLKLYPQHKNIINKYAYN